MDGFDNLTVDYPEGDLSCRVQRLSGVDVAGLGGIFKGSVWYPRLGGEPPVQASRAEMLRSLPHQRRWRRGLPYSVRDAIFPDDVAGLAGRSADVLVCHEAPSTHRHGFAVLDGLADEMKASWVVHGHHHTSYEAALSRRCRVRGLAKAELWLCPA